MPRPLLLGIATLLATAMLVHSALWMHYIRWQPRIYLGLDPGRIPQAGALMVSYIAPNSPAAQAGLQVGDRILSINGRTTNTLYPFYDLLRHGRAEDAVRVIVESGGPAGRHVFSLELHSSPAAPRKLNWVDFFSKQLITSFPMWFLIVSLPVLFLRLEDRNAWLMALLFAGIIAGGPLLILEPLIEPRLAHFAAAYKIIFAGSWAPFFNYFFSVFPVRSFLDRRFPWLKTVLLGASLLVAVPLAVWALFTPREQPLLHLAVALGPRLNVALLVAADFLLPMTLGTASLIGNGFFSESREVQRKIRVIVWGTLAGLLPGLLLYSVPAYLGGGTQRFPLWLWGLICLASFWLFPLSFAYAVLKHRVLEIPVLLKRSARFLMVQWGVHILGILLTITLALLLGRAFSSMISGHPEISVIPAIVLGGLFLWLGIVVGGPVNKRIDRAFFRSSYDARQILEDLAEKTRTSTGREQLASLLENHIQEALHPVSLAMYLEVSDGRLQLVRANSSQGTLEISTELPPLVELAKRGQPWEVPPNSEKSISTLMTPKPECLVPILGPHEGQLQGLLVLGPRLSEETYSREDKRLLASVASQTAGALRSISLAERIAEQLQIERRVARDMEIAKQVQARLFPQKLPSLHNLEYAGRCIQARQVGGDYYDFLSLGAGRIGIVLADIAGKGIPGALLMANLQADVRSQCAIASQDLPQFLKSVNQSFFESTDEGSYATLFFGDYHDSTRRLRFANCGHNPPFLVRCNGTAERLAATATVFGLFEKWESSICDVQIAAGDVLVVYTDGITEANNSAGEEFGESRLLDTIRANLNLPVPLILDAVLAAALEFSHGEQGDDLTLVVARGR